MANTTTGTGISAVKKFMDAGDMYALGTDDHGRNCLVPTSKPTLREFAEDWKRPDLTGVDAAAWEASKMAIIGGIADGTLTYAEA